MEQDNTLFSAPLNDTYHDIVEFAQTYFNSHERTPEGSLFSPCCCVGFIVFVTYIARLIVEIFFRDHYSNSYT